MKLLQELAEVTEWLALAAGAIPCSGERLFNRLRCYTLPLPVLDAIVAFPAVPRGAEPVFRQDLLGSYY